MEIAVAILIGLYCGGLLIFTLAWNGSKGCDFQGETNLKLSVIIPVRDEEENIYNLLNDLNNQQYPKENFEVIVVDDESGDGTVTEVERFLNTSKIGLRLIRQKNGQTYPTPKKKAITKGIMEANGNVIVTTDGDCRVNSGWLNSIAKQFGDQDIQFISGPVVFNQGTNFFEKS